MRRPRRQEQEIDQGRQAFEANCAVCHGMDASGGRGPNLQRAHIQRAPDEASLCDLIESGIPPEMPAGGFLTDVEVRHSSLTSVRWANRRRRLRYAAMPRTATRVFADSGCSCVPHFCRLCGPHSVRNSPILAIAEAQLLFARFARSRRTAAGRVSDGPGRHARGSGRRRHSCQ